LPGEKVEAKCLWNVVNVEGGWRFVQPSYTPVKYYLRSNIEYEPTEYYFMSDPDTIFSEFMPNDKSWLELSTSSDPTVISSGVKEFERKPIITPHFRMLNMSIVLEATNLNTTLDREPMKLTLRYPHDLADSIDFKYTLRRLHADSASNGYGRSNPRSAFYDYAETGGGASCGNVGVSGSGGGSGSGVSTGNSGGGANTTAGDTRCVEGDGELNELLNNCVVSEIISKEDAVIFRIAALPETGSFNFTVYASSISAGEEDSCSISRSSSNFQSPHQIAYSNGKSYASSSAQNMKAIISVRVACVKATRIEQLMLELPPNKMRQISVFGINNTMKRLGLLCCDYSSGVLGTDRENRVNLVFEMQQPLDLEAYLYSADQSINGKFLESCMMKRVVHNFLIITICPPHAGLYGLDLHGALKGSHTATPFNSQLPPIGKYLIKSPNSQLRSQIQFPRGDNRQWGPKQRFYDLGMHTVTNVDPYIVNEDGKQIEIEIAMLKPITLWYKFDHQDINQKETNGKSISGKLKPIDNYCLMNYKYSSSNSSGAAGPPRRNKTVSFLLRFPARGFYHLAIMATDVYPSNPDEIVYNYLIRVQDPYNEVEPFPIIANPILWRDCCLIAPKNYHLCSPDVHFSLIVPGTTLVQITAVVKSGPATYSERIVDKLEPREIENSWVGLVSISDSSRFIYVEAEFDGKFTKLVKFEGLKRLFRLDSN
jgi:hypothetical protein